MDYPGPVSNPGLDWFPDGRGEIAIRAVSFRIIPDHSGQGKRAEMDFSKQPILVRKYGGTSLESVERIKEVARDIALTREQGFRLVVVVSAMGSTTNELAAMAATAAEHPPRREMDMLLSVGERITMSLLSMALAAQGCPAISYTGSQCAIITDDSHTDARILEVKADRVRESLARGLVVVVAGFQGMSRAKEITTLGRGGSDTTAVALAATLGARRCEILKDVDGVLDADPSVIPGAGLHRDLSVEEMQEIAATGSGVVHIRALEYAQKHGVQLAVRSSFHSREGTTISAEHPRSPCTDPPASLRENRYRPLAMSVRKRACNLVLRTGNPKQGQAWRDLILGQLDASAIIAEWMDSGPGFRWEVVAGEGSLTCLLRELGDKHPPGPGDDLQLTEGLLCLSFAGGRPDSWLEVQRHLTELLDREEGLEWRLRADGGSLRVLLRGVVAEDLPRRLHGALLPH